MAMTLAGLTLKQFLALPEQEPALEYFKGKVSQKMVPMGEHSALQVECAERLNRHRTTDHSERRVAGAGRKPLLLGPHSPHCVGPHCQPLPAPTRRCHRNLVPRTKHPRAS